VIGIVRLSKNDQRRITAIQISQYSQYSPICEQNEPDLTFREEDDLRTERFVSTMARPSSVFFSQTPTSSGTRFIDDFSFEMRLSSISPLLHSLRTQADLIDRTFNLSEKRLATILFFDR
jgi:hypothetical protein